MNKLLLITVLFLISCKHEVKTYYIVGKEKKDCGMCCDDKRGHVVSMSIVVPVTQVHAHHHKFEPSEFYLAIAIPYECDKIKVDSLTFSRVNVLDKYNY